MSTIRSDSWSITVTDPYPVRVRLKVTGLEMDFQEARIFAEVLRLASQEAERKQIAADESRARDGFSAGPQPTD